MKIASLILISAALLSGCKAAKDLSEKVSRASALKAQNIKVLTVNSRGKVKDKEEYKASRVDKIKLVFILPENSLTAQEPKDLI